MAQTEPMIIFEKIDDGQTVGISQAREGKWYRSKLAALINSSNISPNSDRAQDFGWRLKPEQQALIEDWEQDPDMIQAVSDYTHVGLDDLTHPNFLDYLLHTMEGGKSATRSDERVRRAREAAYRARVDALRTTTEVLAPFELPAEMTDYKEESVTPVAKPKK